MQCTQFRQPIVRLVVIFMILTFCMPAPTAASPPARLSLPIADTPSVAETSIGNEIVVSALDNEQFLPAVAYNPHHREYLVVWQNNWGGRRDIYAQRINVHGELLSWWAVTTGATDRAQPSVAYDPVNQRYLITWVEDVFGNGSDWDVRGRIFRWNGPDPAFQEFTICDWTTTQWNPKVAYDRTAQEFLVVWWTQQQSGVHSYVSGRRISATSGAPINNPFAIAHHASQERVAPDVAYNHNRNEYLVTYHNGVDVFGTRLRGDGVILGGGEFGIAGWPSTESDSAVASCDATDQYLVVWQALETTGQYNVYARFVSGDGSPDSVHHIYPYPVHQKHPHVACSGTQYLVSWEHQYSNINGPYGVSARLMATDTSMLEPFALVGPTAGIPAQFSRPATAGGHAQFLTVWEHDRGHTAYQDVHGRMVVPWTVYMPMAW